MPQKKPIVVFTGVRRAIPEYFSELLKRVELHSPERSTPQAIEGAKAEALVWVTADPVDQSDLEAMPRLRMLSAWGVGYNHIDVAAATGRRIPVCINPVFSRSMSEAALTLIVALSKRLPQLMRDARAGRRPLQSERGIEIRGRTLGIVGYGRIGADIGELGHILGMKVIAYDPYLLPDRLPEWCPLVTLQALLQAADFFVIAAPLTPETHHLISGPQLALMKPSAYLINIARGPLVDEVALLTALQERRIAGAGLDVWEEEPVSPDNPLLVLDSVIGMPHHLGATRESLRCACEAIQENILRVLAGARPKHAVNPEVFEE